MPGFYMKCNAGRKWVDVVIVDYELVYPSEVNEEHTWVSTGLNDDHSKHQVFKRANHQVLMKY